MNWIDEIFDKVSLKLDLPDSRIAQRVLLSGKPVLVDQKSNLIEPKNLKKVSGFQILENLQLDSSAPSLPHKGKVYDLTANLLLFKVGQCSQFWWAGYMDLLSGQVKGENYSGAKLRFISVESDTLSLISIYFPSFSDQLSSFGKNFQMASMRYSIKVFGCKTLHL